MNKFRAWYLRNQIQITWFLIGLLFFAGLVDLQHGDLFGTILCWGIALINYIFVKRT